MKRKIVMELRTLFILGVLGVGLAAAGALWLQEPRGAFGGNFAPMAQQPFARYQIAGRDSNSAWVIDTAAGDVALIYASGKWKDVGSILDEKNRIRN